MSSDLRRRTLRLHHARVALFLIAGLSACSAPQNNSRGTSPAQEFGPAKAASPPPHMASFARLVGGEWQVTFTSGASAFHAWQWGPGKYSMRMMTHSSDAVANPWAGEVMYWHPGRRQVCVLSLHGDIPGVGRGVGEGSIKFEGETAEGVLDLYQPRGLRKLGSRWVFDGHDRYHATLLEDTGAGLKPMNEWNFVRIQERLEPRTGAVDGATRELSKPLEVFKPLLGHIWEAKGEYHDGSAAAKSFDTQSTLEWVASLEVICARTIALDRDGEPAHLLDAYFYQPVGRGALRCLALSNHGGVYEGDVAVLECGAVQFDLKGYEGDRVVQLLMRFDFESGRVRQRVWSIQGADRRVMLDVYHRREPPIPLVELRGLFEQLDRGSMSGYQCDHTFATTSAFLRGRTLPVDAMLEWLGKNGAGCDCEVMFNVAGKWADIVGYSPPDETE